MVEVAVVLEERWVTIEPGPLQRNIGTAAAAAAVAVAVAAPVTAVAGAPEQYSCSAML